MSTMSDNSKHSQEKLLRNILITNNKTCNLLEMITIMMSLQMGSENPYRQSKLENDWALEKLRLLKRLNKLGVTMGVHNKHKAYKNTVYEQRKNGAEIPLRDV